MSPVQPAPAPASRLARLALAVSGLALALALLVFAYLGQYTRFHADDFCMAGELGRQGFFAAQRYWYAEWSGRYAATFLTTLFALAGPRFAPLLPALLAGFWLAALAWVGKQAGEWLGWQTRWLAGLLFALTSLFALFATIPNRFQSIYWVTGAAAYAWPLALLTLGVGLILFQAFRASRPPKLAALVLNAGLAFLFGGFSETYVALQAALFGLAVALVLLFGRARVRSVVLPLLLAWLLGSLLAMVVVILAPGNTVRQAGLADPPGLVRLVTFSIRNAAHVTGKYFLWHPAAALTSLLLPVALGYRLRTHWLARTWPGRISWREAWRQPWLKGLLFVPLVGFGLITAAVAPAVYALNAYPDDRAIIVPQFILVLIVVTWGYLAGRGLRSIVPLVTQQVEPLRRLPLVLALLAALLSIGTAAWYARQTLIEAPEAAAYAAQWDERDRELRRLFLTGEEVVTVVSLHSRSDLAELAESPQEWVNRCVAVYYGFESVTGR